MNYTITSHGEQPTVLFTNARSCGMCPFDEADAGECDGSAFVEVEWVEGVGLVPKKDPRE